MTECNQSELKALVETESKDSDCKAVKDSDAKQPYCKEIKHAIKMEMTFGSVSQIFNWLFLGSRFNAANENALKKNNVTYIINVAKGAPNYFEDGKWISYHNLQLDDSIEESILIHFESITTQLENIRKNSHNVLVHCNCGISRSATFVLAYLIKYGNIQTHGDVESKPMSLVAAFLFLQSKRAIILPNIGFLQQLEKWEEEIHGKSTLKQLPMFKSEKEQSKKFHPRPNIKKRKKKKCNFCPLSLSHHFLL